MPLCDSLSWQKIKAMQNSDIPDLGPRKTYAKNLAKKLIKSSKISSPPVSLQKIIEHLQSSYTLDVKKVVMGEKVSGLLVTCKSIDGEYTTIGFNANQSWYRNRFTIAHEIGHLLLGHTCTQKLDDVFHAEVEANMFAGELLVPTTLIKIDYKKSSDVPTLSKLYRVSGEVMSIGLMSARLV